MAGNVSDEAFARAVQQAGIATFDEIEAGRAAQAESAKKNVTVSLADVLVQQGVINAKQREGIEKKLQADQQTGGIKQLGPYK
ncbi:MAG: hypothetical protein NTW87_02480, partial [Planctomycetota bacterium]|nr:hypothetical protein [Planctomycetota bacterium]